jgi:hypothetical protein
MITTIKKGASKKEIDSLLESHSKKKRIKGVNVKKYCGVTNLKKDPSELLSEWRKE